jgi:hypothetical protein
MRWNAVRIAEGKPPMDSEAEKMMMEELLQEHRTEVLARFGE